MTNPHDTGAELVSVIREPIGTTLHVELTIDVAEALSTIPAPWQLDDDALATRVLALVCDAVRAIPSLTLRGGYAGAPVLPDESVRF